MTPLRNVANNFIRDRAKGTFDGDEVRISILPGRLESLQIVFFSAG